MLFVVRLSRRGRTIIFSIHQPRFTIFKLFDRLSLLAAGRTVYHGEAADALTYFKSIGTINLNLLTVDKQHLLQLLDMGAQNYAP